MHHAVIMAGGSGTRLWPLSRRARPKQLLRIFNGRSLLRESFERLSGLLPPAQIHVITGHDYLPAMRAELPELPAENLIGEPCPRDTANAVGLAANLLALRDPDGVMGIFTADQIIRPVEVFRETVRRGFDAAERYPDALITFGIRPTSPHTGYGYVQRGRELADGTYEVAHFKEKPDLQTATHYLASGDFYWNSGMFAWRIATILEQFRRHQPEMAAGLAQVAADFAQVAKGNARSGSPLGDLFASLPRISIDYAVLEKAQRVIVVEMPCEWLDVGSWNSLAEVLAPDHAGNTLAAPNVQLLGAAGNILVSESDHLIAAIGVRDLVIVHADDATLICLRQDAQRIKELVDKLKQRGGGRV